MADAYGDIDLRRLEREAEAARARLHDTIAEIKDPNTMENAKLEMKHRAEEMKEQIVGYIKGAKDNALESGRAQGHEFTRKLQRTAIENPLSVALIGAGIGWSFSKKPPITAALIGAGLWIMMKGWDHSPDETAFRDPYNRTAPRGYAPGGVAGYGYDEVTDVASATERLKKVATNLSYGAQSAVSDVQDALSGAAEQAASLGRSAMESAADLRERSAGTMHRAQALGSEHPLLLSAIGLAMGAVLGGMIRQTLLEKGALGSMTQNLRNTAADALHAHMENLSERASHAASAVVGAVTGEDKDDPAKRAQAQRDGVNA